MFSPIGRGWGKQKPPLGAQLLAGHPLAQGLVPDYLTNEARGGTLQDATGKYSVSLSGTGLVINPDGLLASASGQYVHLPNLGFVGNAPCSVRIVVTPSSIPANATFFSFGSASTGHAFILQANSDTSLDFYFWFSDLNVTVPSMTGRKLDLLAVYDPSGQKQSLYLNGVLIGQQTAGVSVSFTDTNYYFPASPGFGGQKGVPGTYQRLSAWHRALTAAEVASLYADPYQMVAPPALWRLAAVQAAGGVTLNATGSPTAQAATVSGAASVPLNAAGSASAQAATGLGAASVPLNAAGAVSAGSAAASGAASVPLNASGAVNAQSATATGAVSVPLNAGGSVSSQAATAAGAGTVSLPGLNADGAVTPGAAASAGLASIPLSALGFLTARPATATGAVSIPLNAAGAVFALSASADGAGTIVQGPTVRRFYFVRAGRVFVVKNRH